MNKLILLILSVLLCGCMDSNVIEVKHQDSGYTSELIGLIPGGKNEYIFLSKDFDDVYAYRLNEDSTRDQFLIDFDTKTFKEIEYKQNNEPIVYYENEEYTILYETEYEHSKESENSIFVRRYYYEKEGKRTFLIEAKEDSQYPFSIVRAQTHPVTGKFMFFIKDFDRNVLSMNEVDHDQLKEISTIDLSYKNYEYKYSQYYDNDFAHVFENEDSILLLSNGNEKIIEKEIEDEYILKDYAIQHEIYLKYENETSILIKNGNEEKVIQKNIDGYELMQDVSNDHTLIYEKDGYQRIVIDGNTYDLGYRPIYHIRKDSVLSSYKDKETKEGQSIYINRKENKVYSLSEYIDLTDIYESYGLFLFRTYANVDNPHYILNVEDNSITIYDLPFSNEFVWQFGINKNEIVYTRDTSEGMEIYLVTLEE